MKSDVMNRFEKITKQIERTNGRLRQKRFFPMIEYPRGKQAYIGVYDSVKKKYEMVEVHHYTVYEALWRMESMLRI